MQAQFKKQVLNRMNYISGHFEGIKTMLKDNKYCLDVMRQNQAVSAAIRKLNQLILAHHLNTCVTEAIQGRDKKERGKKIKELLKVFENSNNI